jgi:hypothetical protein
MIPSEKEKEYILLQEKYSGCKSKPGRRAGVPGKLFCSPWARPAAPAEPIIWAPPYMNEPRPISLLVFSTSDDIVLDWFELG